MFIVDFTYKELFSVYEGVVKIAPIFVYVVCTQPFTGIFVRIRMIDQ